MTINNNIKTLNNLGQSIWYDNLSLDVLESGQLTELINKGVSGLTSNPSIFKKAIADSSTYDVKAAALAKEGKSAEEVIDLLMLDDVARAADLLLPVYENSNKKDGYASIEVSPLLANDTEKTIESAKSFWKQLARPNIMIKVPATPAGIPVIEELISEGINVNVTLIFSTASYEDVISAYFSGLEKRAANGEDISSIASVASFFISRSDVWVDQKSVGKEGTDKFLCKAGLAGGFDAYKVFQSSLESKRFKDLEEKGANIQRILWASTSVKNAGLDPLLYAVSLPYNNSVATHPPALLDLIVGDCVIKEEENTTYESAEVFSAMESAGLSTEEMLSDLLEQGVDVFEQAYIQLVDAVKEKLSSI